MSELFARTLRRLVQKTPAFASWAAVLHVSGGGEYIFKLEARGGEIRTGDRERRRPLSTSNFGMLACDERWRSWVVIWRRTRGELELRYETSNGTGIMAGEARGVVGRRRRCVEGGAEAQVEGEAGY